MRLETPLPSPRYGNRRKLCSRHAIVHNPYVGSIQSVLDSSVDLKPPPSPALLTSLFSQSSHMFGLGGLPSTSASKICQGEGGEWQGRTVTDMWPVTAGWGGGVSQDRLLPRSTKRNAYVGIIRHAPATTNGLKDIWDDDSNSGRRNRTGPLLSQIDLGNRRKPSALSPSDLDNLPLIEFTIPPPSPPKTVSGDPSHQTEHGTSASIEQAVVEQAAAAMCACIHDRCVICLASFQPNDQLRALPCHHAFHRRCIDRWLLGGCTDTMEPTNFCPTCRCVITPKPKAEAAAKDPEPPTTLLATLKEKYTTEANPSFNSNRGEVEDNGIPAWSFLMLGARLHRLENKN